MQAGDQHSMCRESEAAGVADGGVGSLVGEMQSGGQQGWALCAGLVQREPLRAFKRGIFPFYKAHSSWGEVIIVKGKEAGRPVRRLPGVVRMGDAEGLSCSSGIKNRGERSGLRCI